MNHWALEKNAHCQGPKGRGLGGGVGGMGGFFGSTGGVHGAWEACGWDIVGIRKKIFCLENGLTLRLPWPEGFYTTTCRTAGVCEDRKGLMIGRGVRAARNEGCWGGKKIPAHRAKGSVCGGWGAGN